MNCLSKKDVVELLDLPDELILYIMNKVNPHVLLLSSMIGIGNNRLEELALDKCHSIDITFYYNGSLYKLLMKRFCSYVMPCIIHQIQSLTINLEQISYMKSLIGKNSNGILPKLRHLKIMLGAIRYETGMPYTIAQYFFLPNISLGTKLSALCRSSLVYSLESFELDDNCILIETCENNKLRFNPINRLTHIRISFLDFDECVQLLHEIGLQLHSFTVTISEICESEPEPELIQKIESISCPNLKQMTMIMYRNFINYKLCFFLLQRLSNIEYLTLLLSIGVNGITPSYFIDGFILEKNVLLYLPHLRQFNYHIRSILKNTSHITIDQIRQSFVNYKQPFDCVLDHFKNKYGQCQIYSLPFIGNRLDFVSNRFPLFYINKTFSNVTILLLFDDIKPFENIFFENVSRALPRLRTLEIINQLEQRKKTTPRKININFAQLSVLILYDIHMDYAQLFLCQINLPSLIELAINKNILFKIINENHQQAREHCSRIGTIITSKPSYESIHIIRSFFPLAYYVTHSEEYEAKKQIIDVNVKF